MAKVSRTKRNNILLKEANKKVNPINTGESNEKQYLNLNMCFNFSKIDNTQGQSFNCWESDKILAKAMNTIKDICSMKLSEVISKSKKKGPMRLYGDFPCNTDYFHPKHIPEDANWCSLHVQGEECIAGHIVNNVFYVVFLDKEHGFYKCKDR